MAREGRPIREIGKLHNALKRVPRWRVLRRRKDWRIVEPKIDRTLACRHRRGHVGGRLHGWLVGLIPTQSQVVPAGRRTWQEQEKAGIVRPERGVVRKR